MSSTEAESSSPCTVILKNENGDLSGPNSPSSTSSTNFTSNNANSVGTPVGPQPQAISNSASRPTSGLSSSSGDHTLTTTAPGNHAVENRKSSDSRLLDGDLDTDDMEDTDDEDEQKKSRLRAFLGKKEVLLCGIGLITFAIGLILLVVSLMLWRRGCNLKEGRLSNVLGTDINGAANYYPTYRHFPNDYYDEYSDYDLEQNITSSTNASMDSPAEHADQPEVNLALGKRAVQSSVHENNGTYYLAALAVDGIDKPRFNKDVCSQTEWEVQPWWYVDLGELRRVRRLRITIPKDCCAAEMHNFEVRIGQEASSLFTNELCQYHMGTALTESIDLLCRRQHYGRYVSIMMLGDRIRPKSRLTLCEVGVFKR